MVWNLVITGASFKGGVCLLYRRCLRLHVNTLHYETICISLFLHLDSKIISYLMIQGNLTACWSSWCGEWGPTHPWTYPPCTCVAKAIPEVGSKLLLAYGLSPWIYIYAYFCTCNKYYILYACHLGSMNHPMLDLPVVSAWNHVLLHRSH